MSDHTESHFIQRPSSTQSGQSRVAATVRRNFQLQGENDPLTQPEPAYEFDQRIAW